MALGEVHAAGHWPFIDYSQTRGRFIASICFHVEGEWRTFAEIGDGKCIEAAAWPAEIAYFSNRAERDTDFHSYFLNFFGQRANRNEVMPFFSAIEEDIFSLAASFAKLKILQASTEAGRNRMAATEVEYILIVCRSIFDLLQMTLAKTWATFSKEGGQKTKPLKEQFSRMALADKDRIKTTEEIASQFDIPHEFAFFYTRHAPLFVKIRKFRDIIVHGFSRSPMIWHGDKDFLIQRRLGPFTDLKIWRDDELEPNELAPLTPALALMVWGTLLACDEFARLFETALPFPSATVPTMNLYLRGYFDEVFATILQDAKARHADALRLVELPHIPWTVAR